MNFKIGQEVVCLKSHPEGAVKEGEIYTIKDMKIDCCKYFVLDVGVSSQPMNPHLKIGQKCLCVMGIHSIVNDGIWWLDHSRFKPLDEWQNKELNEELIEIFSKQPYEL